MCSPHNKWNGSSYDPPTDDAVNAFAAVLREDPSLKVTIRWPRGRDISAACGQLRTEKRTLRGAALSAVAANVSAVAATAPV